MDIKERNYSKWLLMGDFYTRMDKHEQAIECYLKAAEQGIHTRQINRRLGNRYNALKDYDNAWKHHKIQLECEGWKQDKGYKFSRDYFYSKERTDRWRAVFAPFTGKDGVKYLEIGTREGMSLCWMMENILTSPTSSAVCIDVRFDDLFPHNFKCIENDRVTTHEIHSKELPQHVNDQFDMVYVDGSHFVDDTYVDCVNAFERLKVGGVMIIDDYMYVNFNQHAGRKDTMPGPGIDGFIEVFGDLFEIVDKGWQVIIKKTKEWKTD